MIKTQASPNGRGLPAQLNQLYFQPNRNRRVNIPAPKLPSPSSPTSGHSLPVLGNAVGAGSAAAVCVG